jgi:hypothetical protein
MVEVKDKAGRVKRMSPRIAKALVKMGRLTYHTTALAESAPAVATEKRKPGRPKKEAAEKKPAKKVAKKAAKKPEPEA